MFRFFKKEPEKIEKKELKIEEIEEWLRSENKEHIEELEKNVKELYSEIEESFSELKKTFNEFKTLEIPDVYERLKKAAQTNKSVLEKNIESLLAAFSVPNSPDYRTASEFSSNLLKKIADLGKRNRKGFLILTEAMRDTKKLTKDLGNFESRVIELQKFLNDKGKRVMECEEIIEISRELQSDIKKVPELKREKENLKSALSFQEDKFKKLKRGLEEIEKSKEMSKLKDMKKKLKDLELKKKQIEDRIIHEISYFEKAFKKVYHGEDSKMKFIESPVETLSNSENFKKFKGFIKNIKDSLPKAGLSEKVRAKALTGIERVESGVLDWALKEHKEILNKISNTEKKISKSSVMETKKKTEEEIETWAQLMENTRKRIEKLNIEITGKEENIENRKKLVERKIRDLTGKGVAIT